ncbi:MAG TPA: MASE1 domain-containing protein [Burkholderiales bacterium]|nr:MASE1 domain-containing protein [Burkholderiales bacterium]
MHVARLLAQAGLLGAAYFVTAKLALAMAIPPGYASPIWPGSGLALAALLLGGSRLWPAIWLGSAAANLSVETSLIASAAIATGSSIQALAGAALLRHHIGIPHRFRRAEEVVKFMALAALTATVAPTIALLPLALLHPLTPPELFWNWWTWWQGDASGILLVAPLMLSWAGGAGRRWTGDKLFEGTLFGVLLVAATQLVFQGAEGASTYAASFLVLPFIVWAAFRFSQREVTTAIAVVCALALWHTPPTNEARLLLLLFVSTAVFTGLMISAVLGQLGDAMAALQGRQQQLERRVSERTHDLFDSERRFRLMVESVVDYSIFMLDAQGRVASWNAGAERTSGYRAAEIIGRHFSCFYPREEIERRKPEWELELAAAEGRFEEEGWRVRKDGSTYWASVVITAVRDPQGALLGFAKVVRDLTERNRVEAELIRARVSAEKASEAKSQFLANMSHELRTPLNSLLILARLLADNAGGNLTDKQVQFAQTIYDSGMDLLSLINDLLDLAKIESGAVTALHLAPARLDELAADLERSFAQVAQDKGLEFRIALDPALPPAIRTDTARLKQVLKNLLANAFKFTRQGSVVLRVSPVEPGRIAFEVIDTGIGIPPEKQRIIFDAFQQADGTTSRQYGGTGLGLSISRELARLLGGELEVASEPGRGSTFTLLVPASDEVSALAA